MTVRSDRFQSLLLAIILAIGAGAAWGLGIAWLLVLTVDNLLPVDDRAGSTQYIAVYDGAPVIQTRRYGYQTGNPQDVEDDSYRTLAGESIDAKPGKAHDIYGPSFIRGPGYRKVRFNALMWSNRVERLANGVDEQWFFINDGKPDGRGYLVGYNVKLNVKIGYLGRAGFSRDEPPVAEQFPVDGRALVGYGHKAIHSLPCRTGQEEDEDAESHHYPNGLFLQASDGLVRINLKDRTATTFWSGPGLIWVEKTSDVKRAKKESRAKLAYSDRILLRTLDRLILLDVDGKVIRDFPLPAEFRDAGFSWYPLLDDAALVVIDETSLNNSLVPGIKELYWLDPSGKVVRQQEVDLRDPPSKYEALNKVVDTFRVSLALASPGTLATAILTYPWTFGHENLESLPYSAALIKAFHNFRWELLIMSLTSIVLATLCYRRQRKYGLPWTPVWTVFVLLFGLPAYFAYLAHRVWPARLACPHCAQLAPRDRPACIRCGHDFPQPAMKGTEVFA
jgi:hypothetical protein